MATRGFENFTATDAARHALKHATMPQKRRSKYGAIRTEVDGIVFDSKREAARYQELKALERAGEISGLCLQPSYCLEAPKDHGGPSRSSVVGVYRADFAYFDKSGREIVEDSKGFKTPLYRWKKKHVEAQYGIEIREV